MTRRTWVAVLLVGFASAAVLPAQSTAYYIVDGDSDTGFIVQNGTLVDTFSTSDVPGSIGYAIAVRDTILLGDRDDVGAAEYTLAGAFTGNTFTGGDNFSEILDGAAGGTSNYGALFSDATATVIVADQNWEGAAVLFNLGFSSAGVTFDPTDGTLYVVDDSAGIIRHLTLAGSELGNFDPNLSRACCLAYENATDTLWMADNQDNEVIYQFSKTGTLLDTVPVTGLTGNYFGGEMAAAPGSAPPGGAPEIPTLGPFGLALLAGSVAGAAGVLLARSRRG